jgi:hypothetical protein
MNSLALVHRAFRPLSRRAAKYIRTFGGCYPPLLAEGFSPRRSVPPKPPRSFSATAGLGRKAYTMFSGRGFTATSRNAIRSAMTTNTPVNKATPGQPAWLQATPPADPRTLEPTYKKKR